MEDLGERARWLSAVLIVVSIAAVTTTVRLWPAQSALRAAGTLRSRPLHLFDAPTLEVGIAASVLGPAPTPRATEVAPMPGAPPEAITVAAIDVVEPPARTDGEEVGAERAPADALTLASRSLAIPRFDPVTVAPSHAAHLTEGSSSTSFVEIPVVVMSRALEVAGRGIKSSVRATGALVRLAF